MYRLIALASVLALGGCGGGAPSGASASAARTTFIDNCEKGARTRGEVTAELAPKITKLCTCSADKLAIGTPESIGLGPPSQNEAAKVARECATESGLAPQQGA